MSVITILNYHSVSDSPVASIAPFAVGPTVLARHLDLIVAGHHPVFTVAELAKRLERDDVPRRTVVITFDDGFEDNLSVAAPLLRERRLPATVFVTTGFLSGVDGPACPPPGPMLAWDQLADLEAAGIEVGSHAHTHRQLDVLSRAEAGREIRLGRELLESALRHRVTSLAYPHGYASAAVEAEARASGFRSACGVGNAFSHPGDNRWHLSRLTIGAATSDEVVQRWLNGTGAPVAPAHEALRTTAWRTARRAGAIRRRLATGAQV
jgi:peptidoglycan/xylan/chitin deacetylase (PgdA/CDA1 family)